MNVSDQIIKVLNDLCEKFGIAIDWTATNIVPYIEKLLSKFIHWEIMTSIFWMALMSILTLICFFIAKKCTSNKFKYYKDEDWDFCSWGIGAIVSWILFAVLAVCAVSVIGKQVYDIITCITFPEMMIVDEIKSLISSNTQNL